MMEDPQVGERWLYVGDSYIQKDMIVTVTDVANDVIYTDNGVSYSLEDFSEQFDKVEE